MNNLVINPRSLSLADTIHEDSKLRYFISNSLDNSEQTFQLTVEEGVHLELTLIDFSFCDLQCNLLIHLKRKSSVEISLASIGCQDKTKVFHCNVTHDFSDTTSKVSMSGINIANGVLRFLGDSLIVNGAHRSSTRQEGKITNLSLEAKSEVSPSLLIKENDVQASHGAALGAYNPDQVFYLMSRGLSLQESKKLITFGSLLPMIEKLEDDKLVSQAKETLEALSL